MGGGGEGEGAISEQLHYRRAIIGSGQLAIRRSLCRRRHFRCHALSYRQPSRGRKNNFTLDTEETSQVADFASCKKCDNFKVAKRETKADEIFRMVVKFEGMFKNFQ